MDEYILQHAVYGLYVHEFLADPDREGQEPASFWEFFNNEYQDAEYVDVLLGRSEYRLKDGRIVPMEVDERWLMCLRSPWKHWWHWRRGTKGGG